MTEIKKGATRVVFLIGRWAIKIPRLCSWRNFLQGLLANQQEAVFGRLGWDGICPVLLYLPGGFLVVMPRAEPVPDDFFLHFQFDDFVNREDYTIPVEYKLSSFGFIGEKIVAVDYGN